MERNQISDKELQMILDYFKQFQIRLAEMNIDDLMLKLKENRLTDKEKAKIDEDFATMRHLPEFQEPIAKPFTRGDGVFTDEEIAAIIAAANTPMNTDPVLSQPEIDAIVEAMTKKLRESQRPALTEKQIDYIIQITRDKQWWEMSKAEQKEILGNIPFL